MSKILVVYSSKHRSTAEIATFIGNTLLFNGFIADVCDVEDVKSVTDYDAVILGSAVYMGRWLKSAVNFLRQNQLTLAERPMWIFSTGPTGKGNPAELLEGFLLPDNAREFTKVIQPRHVMLFHGKLDFDELGFGERMIVKAVDAPVGDFRDWDMIRVWTNRIIAELRMPEEVMLR